MLLLGGLQAVDTDTRSTYQNIEITLLLTSSIPSAESYLQTVTTYEEPD